MAIIVLGALGLIFGILLAVAGKVFAVEKDPKEEAVRACLAGANCGGCGYPGCDGYAAAVASGEAATNLCSPGGAEAAAKIAEIMGVSGGSAETYVAFVRCSGTCGHRAQKFEYQGLDSCIAATRLGGGSGPNVCSYGCMGCGDCVKACQFGAMHIVDGIAKVDRSVCVGCMKCAEACPKGMIEKVPASSTDIVACQSRDKGPVVTKACDYGCIGCQNARRNARPTPSRSPTSSLTSTRACASTAATAPMCARAAALWISDKHPQTTRSPFFGTGIFDRRRLSMQKIIYAAVFYDDAELYAIADRTAGGIAGMSPVSDPHTTLAFRPDVDPAFCVQSGVPHCTCYLAPGAAAKDTAGLDFEPLDESERFTLTGRLGFYTHSGVDFG